MKHNCEAKIVYFCNGRLARDGCKYWQENTIGICRYNFDGICIRADAKEKALEKFMVAIKRDLDNEK